MEPTQAKIKDALQEAIKLPRDTIPNDRGPCMNRFIFDCLHPEASHYGGNTCCCVKSCFCNNYVPRA